MGKNREFWISIAVGVILMGALVYGFSQMGKRVAGLNLTGVITEKIFTPLGEEQVTIGRKGKNLTAIKVDGEYELRVKVGDKEYIVPVRKEVYEKKQVGETFTFPRPPK